MILQDKVALVTGGTTGIGRATAIASGVQDAIGRNPHSFEKFAHDYAAMFK
jgi:NAD(P)-dependent dehydrogenase (short-subunit alcohol dehydrogenase family)